MIKSTLIQVGEGSMNAFPQKCTPFVSMYSDCTPDNRCEGCSSCSCSAQGRWECELITEGCQPDQDQDEDITAVDDKLIDTALNEMMSELKKKVRPEKKRYVPGPSPPPETMLVRKINKVPAWDDYNESAKEDEAFVVEDLRRKRSVENKKSNVNKNKTITFHHTVDEINEDTLKNTNTSGTLPAAKVEMIPLSSRRTFPLNNNSTPLQIEYSPPLQSQHSSDNKVDSTALHDDQLDLLVHHKMYQMIGNQSQASRDKDLSKLVVNELKGGAVETIGDKGSPVISNITFTPENDTLTAMAFIAGNLLNKLWNIERDTDDSLETEHMKHKKINDLLELFKEPLNLRQETFLKNALQHLSTAIENKNIENVSLCENIEDFKKKSGIMDESNQSKPVFKARSSTTPETDKMPIISKKTAASEALNKIGNILDLIKKYERTQNALNNVKNSSNANSTIRKSLDEDEKTNILTKDEKTTLNVFGNILESLTKLIIPNKMGKKLIKELESKNLFKSNIDVKNKFNLTGISLTTKDKIVLDYVTHIQNNPDCLLRNPEKQMLPNIRGDILRNLSDFLNVKSMSDLIKLANTENKKEDNILRAKNTKLDMSSYENFYTTETITAKTTTTKIDNDIRFEITKNKLKGHLKTILEDIIELQNISGKSINRKNIEISEVLPCIYNLVNNKKELNNDQYITKQKNIISATKTNSDPVNKISDILNNLKKELKFSTQTRRTNIGNGRIPKSAIVWERTVKNLGTKKKLQTRRNLQGNVPKSFEDVKAIINKMESSGSNTYKSIAYLGEILPAERLLLLKTLALDTKRYIATLSDISRSINSATTLPLDQFKTISEFLGNVNLNLNLNRKVVSNLDKPKKGTYLPNRDVSSPKTVYDVVKGVQDKSMNFYSKTKGSPFKTGNVYSTAKVTEKSLSEYNTVKLSRDQIVNQLIKNRMMYYLKLKEETGDEKSDINMELANRILLYLEIGNDNLARELFKIFISQKKIPQKSPTNAPADPVTYDAALRKADRIRSHAPEPLIQFEDLNEDKRAWYNQDQLMKQLMNIQNMML